jgi:hypothetical protein
MLLLKTVILKLIYHKYVILISNLNQIYLDSNEGLNVNKVWGRNFASEANDDWTFQFFRSKKFGDFLKRGF